MEVAKLMVLSLLFMIINVVVLTALAALLGGTYEHVVLSFLLAAYSTREAHDFLRAKQP